MALVPHELDALRHFLPNDKAYDMVRHILEQWPIPLEIKKDRKRILGNYSVKGNSWNYQYKITINGHLPPYQFFITFLHEMAHHLTFLKHKDTVDGHGKEWKSIYGSLLRKSVELHIYPQDIEVQVSNHANNPKASSCNDNELFTSLYAYENKSDEWTLLSLIEVQPGQEFETKDNKKFKIIKKMRKNYKIEELGTSHIYIAPPTLEIRMID